MSGIYHSWNGTVLTVTSDSGTSSADLQGAMGVRGPQGVPGDGPANVEQLEERVEDLESIAGGYVSWDNFHEELESALECYPSLDTIESMVAENKAVIVTANSDNVTDYSSQEIYEFIQEGKAVYLHLWGNTYMLCSTSTESEAKFESSYLNTITGTDGKTYDVQRFRLFYVADNRLRQNSLDTPGKEYIDAKNAFIITVNGSTPSATNAEIHAAAVSGREVYLFLWSSTYVKATYIAPTYAWFEGTYLSTETVEDKTYSVVKYRLFTIENDRYKQNTQNLPKLDYIVDLEKRVAALEAQLNG